MQTVSLEDAQKNLRKLLRELDRGGGFVITDANKPVAKVCSVNPRPSLRNIKPKCVGPVLRPFPSPEDDLLEEMLNVRS